MKPTTIFAGFYLYQPTQLSRTFAVSLLALLMTSALQAAACPRAVFFDLGDTLVQSGPGGLAVAKPGAQQTLDLLDAAGVQLGVITNVPAGFTRPQLNALLADPSFLDIFDTVVLSSQAPAPKPNPLIYLHAHSLLPMVLPISESTFVGENLPEIGNSAVAPSSGARAVGMSGIHLSFAAPSVLADFTIAPDQLPNIATLVATLCSVHVDGFEAAER